jgi:type IV pilus assembly protein PilF
MNRAATVFFLTAVLLLGGCAATAQREAEQERIQKLVTTKTQLGGLYMMRGQLDIANEELTGALALDRDNSYANNVMAVLQWKLKHYDDAERYFRRALDSNPGNSEAHRNYGVFLCERGQADKGVREIEKAANDPLYSDVAGANVNAGICMQMKGSTSLAEQYFREALRINPKQPRALLEMARLSFDSGQALSARGFIQRYFLVGPETPGSLLLAAHIERALRNRDGEANYAVRLRDKFPDSSETAQLTKEYSGNNARK